MKKCTSRDRVRLGDGGIANKLDDQRHEVQKQCVTVTGVIAAKVAESDDCGM
jgi:hypothetical protein